VSEILAGVVSEILIVESEGKMTVARSRCGVPLWDFRGGCPEPLPRPLRKCSDDGFFDRQKLDQRHDGVWSAP
jgi:hypothetical protein